MHVPQGLADIGSSSCRYAGRGPFWVHFVKQRLETAATLPRGYIYIIVKYSFATTVIDMVVVKHCLNDQVSGPSEFQNVIDELTESRQLPSAMFRGGPCIRNGHRIPYSNLIAVQSKHCTPPQLTPLQLHPTFSKASSRMPLINIKQQASEIHFKISC